jgi:tetratricopeptide (TPR) repeat protein
MNTVYQSGSNSKENFLKLFELRPLIKETHDKNLAGDYFVAYSGAHSATGNKDSALYYENVALRIFEESGNLEKVARIRANQISAEHNQYLSQNKYEEVIALIPRYEQEIKFATEHSKYALAYNTRHLAQIHLNQTKNYNEALRLFKASLTLREEIGFRPFIPASYSSLGDVYAKIQQHEMAIEMYTQSATLATEIGFIRYRISPLLAIADIYLTLKKTEMAKEYLREALQIASDERQSAYLETIRKKIDQLEN